MMTTFIDDNWGDEVQLTGTLVVPVSPDPTLIKTIKNYTNALQHLVDEILRDPSSYGHFKYSKRKKKLTWTHNIRAISSRFYEELKTKFPLIMGSNLFNLLIIQMEKQGAIVSEDDSVRLSGYSVSLGADQSEQKKKISKIYQRAGLKPPYFRDIPGMLGIDIQAAKDVLMLLIKEGSIIKAKDDLYFERNAVDVLQNKLLDFFAANAELTTPRFKELACVSRKYLIPLIEYFDSINFTIRIGDVRKLRRK